MPQKFATFLLALQQRWLVEQSSGQSCQRAEEQQDLEADAPVLSLKCRPKLVGKDFYGEEEVRLTASFVADVAA